MPRGVYFYSRSSRPGMQALPRKKGDWGAGAGNGGVVRKRGGSNKRNLGEKEMKDQVTGRRK